MEVHTAEVHTATHSIQSRMNIQLKVPEPKAFDGDKKDAKSWLK